MVRERRPAIVNVLLFPFMLLYGLAVIVRNALFDWGVIKPVEFNIPVISVGNITVGGTGKTPHVEYLVSILSREFAVAVLSRGYKRKSSGFAWVTTDSTDEQAGDEPLQIKMKFPGVTVAVDEKRVRGIRRLLKVYPRLDVVILDDAFQHRYVKPGLSIMLVDYNRPFYEDRLLPVGRLREPAWEKKRAPIVIATKSPNSLKPIDRRLMVKNLNLYPFQSLYFSTYSYGHMRQVFPPHNPHPDEDSLRRSKPRIIMVTGIATPRNFKRYLRGISTKITELTFPDHHRFKKKDILKITEKFNEIEDENKIILTTEKDAVRLLKFDDIPPEVKDLFYYVSIEVAFAGNEGERFNSQIIRYVRENKRSHLIC